MHKPIEVSPDVINMLAAAAPASDTTGAFPWAGIKAVHQSGLLEQTVGSHFAGSGALLIDMAKILAELGRGDPSVALIASMTLLVHLNQATKSNWPDDLYRRVLAEAKNKPTLLNTARVEPELGSPARGGLPATIARRTAEGWSITGRKRFVTGALGLSYFLVWARTDDLSPFVGTFIVPAKTDGIRIIENWRSLGMRASGSHDVEFDNVEVALENVLDFTEAGAAEQDNGMLAGINLALTAIYLGVAEAAQQAFIRFGYERIPTNLGYPIARTDRYIGLAGEIDLRVSGARDIVFGALSRPRTDAHALIRARLLAGRHIKEAVQIAVSALGNPGLGADLGLERHFRDIQAVLVHAPQEDTAVTILGRAVLAAGAPSVPSPQKTASGTTNTGGVEFTKTEQSA